MQEATPAGTISAGPARSRRTRTAGEPVLLLTATVPSPIGPLALYAIGGSLCGLSFGPEDGALKGFLQRRFGPALRFEPGADPAGAASSLEAYFAGRLTAFDELTVDAGGTPFQASVWAALRRIPPGRTVSYGDIARTIEAPKAVRAVGLANGSNPVSIVIPCHRVLASDGTLHGYGGGLDRKEWLLRHENAWGEGRTAG